MSPGKPRRKKARRQGPRAPKHADLRSAIAEGRRRGKEVLELRARQRSKRARVVSAVIRTQSLFPSVTPRIKPQALASLGPAGSAGVLIAEGDSWFDYPFHDVLGMLEDEHGFDVVSVAHRGDRVEDMAFAGGQLDKFCRQLEKLLREGKVPRAILLSGGGNDIAGDQFEMLLNHADSPIAGLNDDIVRGVIDQRIRTALAFIISSITTISDHYLSDRLPILIHGYAHAVPDGRGFLGGFSVLPGPWLKPGFQEKGFADLKPNTDVVRDLIDRFNAMLKTVTGQFGHVHYVDLRRLLSNDSDYKNYWANELHPTKSGFSLVANEFAAAIAALP